MYIGKSYRGTRASRHAWHVSVEPQACMRGIGACRGMVCCRTGIQGYMEYPYELRNLRCEVNLLLQETCYSDLRLPVVGIGLGLGMAAGMGIGVRQSKATW